MPHVGINADTREMLQHLAAVVAGASAAMERLADALEEANKLADSKANGPRG